MSFSREQLKQLTIQTGDQFGKTLKYFWVEVVQKYFDYFVIFIIVLLLLIVLTNQLALPLLIIKAIVLFAVSTLGIASYSLRASYEEYRLQTKSIEDLSYQLALGMKEKTLPQPDLVISEELATIQSLAENLGVYLEYKAHEMNINESTGQKTVFFKFIFDDLSRENLVTLCNNYKILDHVESCNFQIHNKIVRLKVIYK